MLLDYRSQKDGSHLCPVLSPKAHTGPGEQWILRARGVQGLAVKRHPAEFAEQINEGFMARTGRTGG